MASTLRRVQKHPKTYLGEADATRLVRLLNDESFSSKVDIQTVSDLIELFRILETLTKTKSDARDHRRKLTGIRSEINLALRKYKVSPFLFFPWQLGRNEQDLSDWSLEWGEFGTRKDRFSEITIVLNIIALAAQWRLSAVKQCAQCQRWLFARFSHQKFCSDECKEQFHRTDPGHKARRREWARDNYWKHRNKNVK